MKQSRKDFIKRLHDGAWSGIKKDIEKEFPKLFKEDELFVGKWYYYRNWLIEYAGKTTHLTANYGFDDNGNYFYDSKQNSFGNTPKEWVLATDEEVERALIKEAKNRGFKEGVRFKSKWMSRIIAKLIDGKFLFDNRLELCYKNDGGMLYTLFENGVWAEIIKETITKEQAEKELGKTIIN